jgi:CRISPR-associated protein Cmr6
MNLNYLLNKAYYDELSYKHFDNCNEALTGRQFQSGEKARFSDSGFCLQTVYPGLLNGIGNTHEAGTDILGEEKDGAEIKLGFTLDYVTGLPVIPGSTVKGVLRSAFKNHPEYVATLLGIEQKDIKILKTNIGDIESKIFGTGDDGGNVIFFDAVPVKAGKDNKLFGLDNITPHHSDPLKSPTPLTMLKVLPGVVFLFRFGFDRGDKVKTVMEGQLKEAFKTILTDLGIGAKTNVGFGVLKSAEPQLLSCAKGVGR